MSLINYTAFRSISHFVVTVLYYVSVGIDSCLVLESPLSEGYERCTGYNNVFRAVFVPLHLISLRLRPITIHLIKARNLFILAAPLPPEMMSVWRSNAGSLLPTGATMVSMGN